MRRILVSLALALALCLMGCASSSLPPYSATPKSVVSASTFPAPSLPQVAPPAEGAFRLTILYDNATSDARLKADWGFSVLADYDGHRILFDTGASGPILVENMRRLGVDPRSIEAIAVSHEHYDHTGGLWSLLDMGVERVLPTHCTSAKARGAFKGAFGDSALEGVDGVLEGGVGRLIECPPRSAASR